MKSETGAILMLLYLTSALFFRCLKIAVNYKCSLNVSSDPEMQVGMRQIVDYYMVLRTVNYEKQSVEYALDAVSDFGIDKFARGLMWVLKEALGMPEDWTLWEPDQKEGEYILKQIMTGGNFGHYDERLNHGGGKIGAVKAILTHNLHLLTHYPSDVIWAPVWIVWHKLWKMTRRV